VTYASLGMLTFYAHTEIGMATMLWAPGAVAFAVLLLCGLRWWPGVFIGVASLLLFSGAPLTTALLIALNDVIEVCVGTVLLVSVLQFRVELDRVRDVIAFIGVSIAVSLYVATANTFVLAAGGYLPVEEIGARWWAWWWANICGALIVTPAILTCVRRTRRPAAGGWRGEWFTLLFGGIALVLIGLATPVINWLPESPYFLLPLLVWAGVRYGPRGASVATFGASLSAIAMYALGLGLFDRLVDLQSFIAITTVSTLTLSALVLERQRAIERQATIQQVALDAIISLDGTGRVLEMNPAAETMFRVRARDAVGCDLAAIAIPPRLRDTFHRAFRHFARTGEGAIAGCRYRTTAWRASDQSEFAIEVAVTPIVFEDRIIYTGFIRDISAEVAAAAVLRSAHEDLERQVEQRTAELRAANLAIERKSALMKQAEELAAMGSFEFETGSKVLKWSDELYKIYGRDQETYIPTFESFIDAIHPEDRATIAATIDDAIAHKKPFNVLERVVLPNGTIRILQTTARVLGDGDGQMRLVGCCRDVTKREAAERTRSRLVQLVESSDDPILGLSADGRIETWNAAAERLFGFEANDVLGRSVTMLVAPEGRGRLLDLFDAIRAGEHVSHYELDHVRRDGTRFPASVTTSAVLGRNGSVVGMSKVIRDVTKQKRVEHQLRASLREKDVLLREIHHRVKNNLQVIASLLNIQMTSDLHPESHKGLIESQNRIQSMALVHQLLYQSKDLAQIEFGEYLAKLARRLTDTYDVGADRIAVEVLAAPMRLDVDHAIPCGLIVNELLTNAISHAFPGGQKGTIRITVEAQGNDVTLTVQDDGIGIPADLRIDEAHSFGLRIARTLTQQLDGTIALSREEHGTKVQLRFPISKGDPS
jgi:PAS domain S-box-containing protein